MEEHTKVIVNQNLPWKRDVKWPIVAGEAAVLIVIGAFILIDQETASDVILQLIGVVLLATSAAVAWASFREPETRLGNFDSFRAGIGITAGAIATVSWWSDYIDNHAVRVILGWALIAYTILHIVGLVSVRGRSGLRPSVLVASGLSLVLGILMVTGDDSTSESRLTLLGTVVMIGGLLLAGLAYYLYREASKSSADVTTTGSGAAQPVAAEPSPADPGADRAAPADAGPAKPATADAGPAKPAPLGDTPAA
jgi:uncharacterized membrane protein HdeD (DUF308 family)